MRKKGIYLKDGTFIPDVPEEIRNKVSEIRSARHQREPFLEQGIPSRRDSLAQDVLAIAESRKSFEAQYGRAISSLLDGAKVSDLLGISRQLESYRVDIGKQYAERLGASRPAISDIDKTLGEGILDRNEEIGPIMLVKMLRTKWLRHDPEHGSTADHKKKRGAFAYNLGDLGIRKSSSRKTRVCAPSRESSK